MNVRYFRIPMAKITRRWPAMLRGNIGRGLASRQPNGEARAQHLTAIVGAVFGADLAAVVFHNLLRDRQAETGMGAEFFAGRPLGIEALEYRGEFAFGNAGPLIVDRHDDVASVASRRDPNRAAGRTERDRVGDEIAEDLAEPAFDAGYRQIAGGRSGLARQ